jgi:AraC family transcriptional regulator, transcriptional activator of pobA
MKKASIPQYSFDSYRPVHREITQRGQFGYAAVDPAKYIPGFEVYSKKDIRPAFGLVKVNAYRVGFTTRGSVEVDLGLDTFIHYKSIITITAPGSIFSYRNASADYEGYYCLFEGSFLEPCCEIWIPNSLSLMLRAFHLFSFRMPSWISLLN